MHIPHAPVIAATALCAYAFVRLRLNEAAQPKRLELAERGEALLASGNLNDNVKSHVRYCLDRAFGARGDLLLHIIIIPAFALLVLFSMGTIKNIIASNKINDKAARNDAREFFQLYDQISYMNNPILATIVVVEFGILVSIAAVIRIVLSNGPPTLDRWVVKPAIEELMRLVTHSRRDGIFMR